MRTSWIVILACVVLAGSGCGGKAFGGDLGDAGDDGGSGGGSGSGSGGSSSSGGGSSGGVCPASPGEGTCSAGEQCNYGSGCSETFCSCGSANHWVCSVSNCPPPVCPSSPPVYGEACYSPGESCGYPTGGGCGMQCDCNPSGQAPDAGLVWQCYSPPCPPPSCPPAPPQTGEACTSVNQACDYTFDSGCGGAYCTCEPSGTWSCVIGDCIDAGPPIDAGTWGG